jgi:hypothetical protein
MVEKEKSYEKEKDFPNVKTLEKPSGKYTFIYQSHSEVVDPRSLPKDCNQVFIESGVNDYLTRNINLEEVFLRGSWVPAKLVGKEVRPHAPLKEELEKRNGVCYFGELVYQREKIVFTASMLATILETAIGFSLLKRAVEELHKALESKEKINRRNFLASAAAGLWFLLPVTSQLSTGSSHLLTGGPARETEQIRSALYPKLLSSDLFLITLRNVVVTHKMEWLAQGQAKQSGRVANFSAIFGAGHVGMEGELLKDPKERLAFLKAAEPIMRQVIKPESLYTLVPLRFGYEDPRKPGRDEEKRWWGPPSPYEDLDVRPYDRPIVIPELKEILKK